ncbi:MAG: hypothetical protein BAJALOKI2v1_10042 [Promethearchaeota archaeon]|nr:MAG: hypothetical protein BAJALOKI2v1_10042 [Candidatus Lokiarchaeota archaeon]
MTKVLECPKCQARIHGRTIEEVMENYLDHCKALESHHQPNEEEKEKLISNIMELH